MRHLVPYLKAPYGRRTNNFKGHASTFIHIKEENMGVEDRCRTSCVFKPTTVRVLKAELKGPSPETQTIPFNIFYKQIRKNILERGGGPVRNKLGL